VISFRTSEPFPGWVYAYPRKGIVRTVALALDAPISRQEVVKLFGTAFKEVHYSFDNCPDDGETGPIHEDPNGDFVHLLAPSRGLALVLNDSGRVTEIVYLSGDPHIPKHSHCSGRKE
jgi:hypothetical protein